VIHFWALNDGFGIAILAEAHEQQAEGGDHGHQTEIGGHEQTGQNYGGDHLDGEDEALCEDSNASPANSKAAQTVTDLGGLEISICVERSQALSKELRSSHSRIPTASPSSLPSLR